MRENEQIILTQTLWWWGGGVKQHEPHSQHYIFLNSIVYFLVYIYEFT